MAAASVTIALPWRVKASLHFQRMVGFISFFWLAPFIFFLHKFFYRYGIANHRELRRNIDRILQESESHPLIICANHLTKIDSILIFLFLFRMRDTVFNFRLLPWNVPEIRRVSGNPFYAVICFVAKCVFIRRGSSSSHQHLTLSKLSYLLSKKELICIFPEGQRSRVGRVDPSRAAYGVGQILQAVPDAKVLCVYLRGINQKNYSSFPHRGDPFYCDLKVIKPTTDQEGRRGARDLSMQIIHQLKEMEDVYFTNR
jgi:1-acyl-sn-glycerol-3-phosphate acyltransferase